MSSAVICPISRLLSTLLSNPLIDIINFIRTYWRATFVFVCLAAIVFAWKDVRSSIEWTALLFFAAVGASAVMLDYANMKLTAAPAQLAYQVRRHIPWVCFLGMISGVTLATGGGAIRRAVEWAAAVGLSIINLPLRSCYKLSNSILPPVGDSAWGAIGYGIIVGSIVGLLITWDITDTQERKDTFDKEVLAVDGFGTGFFAAYGVEAAIRFVDALPVGDQSSLPSPLVSAVHISTFYGLGFALVAVCSLVTGCGGGLLKDLVVNLLLRRWTLLREKLSKWFSASAVRYAGAIGLTAWIPYMVLDKNPVLGACRSIDPSVILPLMLLCAFIATTVWIKFVQHEPN